MENTKLKIPFKWKPNGAPEISVNKMETRHLWFTLRMIWNHTMPEHQRFKPYRHYSFGPKYTSEYMLEAVKEILKELAGRKDMQESWWKELLMMDGICRQQKIIE